jgi:phage terminase large subunit
LLQASSSDVDRKRSRGAGPRSPFAALAAVAERVARKSSVVTFPSPQWRDDPVGFSRDVLGLELWTAQVAILEAIRDNRNTTVRSGHKCGKSTALAVAALWFYCSFPRARVVMTAVKASQIDEVIWKEVRRLYRGAKIPIGGELYALARSGLRDPKDDRQVWGITARDGEGLAGISGPNVLVLTDEASGIPDRFFEVLGSSLAGSGGTARKCYISNPTRTTGEFYRSHTTNAHLFKCLHVSSEDTPNARGTGEIPGLAGPEWIAEKKLEYGDDSALYRIRVKGEFVENEVGQIISVALLSEAESRWADTPAEGNLCIGIDPAGDGEGGDETAFAVRRGQKVLRIFARRSLSVDGILGEVLGIIREFSRHRDEPALISLDSEGVIGGNVAGRLIAHLHIAPDAFEVSRVKASTRLPRPPYERIRDALWGNLQRWLEEGGAIPEDVKLANELTHARLEELPGTGRVKVTPKTEMRKLLGRSPDRADALALCVWQRSSTEAVAAGIAVSEARNGSALDPYDDGDAERADRLFDPYGGGLR